MYALFARKPSIIIRDQASKQYSAIHCNDLSTFSLVAIQLPDTDMWEQLSNRKE